MVLIKQGEKKIWIKPYTTSSQNLEIDDVTPPYNNYSELSEDICLERSSASDIGGNLKLNDGTDISLKPPWEDHDPLKKESYIQESKPLVELNGWMTKHILTRRLALEEVISIVEFSTFSTMKNAYEN